MSQQDRFDRIMRGAEAYGPEGFLKSFDHFVSEISGPSTMDEIFASMERPWLDEEDRSALTRDGEG